MFRPGYKGYVSKGFKGYLRFSIYVVLKIEAVMKKIVYSDFNQYFESTNNAFC